MIERDWHNLYSQSWQGEIVDEAFGHPAKFSRGLIRAIYDHALGQGWLKPGDVILDPFGGVGLGAKDAPGQWVGIELEQYFVDMGDRCDCTGMSKEDWIQFYGRWKRVAYRDGRHWCPRCLAQAEIVLPPDSGQLSFLDPILKASYVRNSGKIPFTQPHHYVGNIELWGNGAILIQGDSRELVTILSQVGGVVSSPPYANQLIGDNQRYMRPNDGRPNPRHYVDLTQEEKHRLGYSSNPQNLGNLREGNFDAVVGSPPFQESNPKTDGRQGKGKYSGTDLSQGLNRVKDDYQGYGNNLSNLANLPPGNFDAVLGSPPFGETGTNLGDVADTKGMRQEISNRSHKRNNAYGVSDGQLGKMRVVSSPPYANQSIRNNADYDEAKLEKAKATGKTLQRSGWGANGNPTGQYGYGNAPGNLGNSASDDFWHAALTIMQQVYSVLPQGAVAIWVLKGFVRDKKYVDFPNQWKQLGEACGFTTIEWIRAWLLERRGTQYDLSGNPQEKVIERKSFFRRLAESKGSPRIDYEIVLIQQKP